MEIITQVSGWIGALLIVIAYFLVASDKVDDQNKVIQFMNLFGALGIGMNVFYQKAWPALTLQIVWGAVAVFALFRILNRK